MKKFDIVKSKAVPLMLANIDTDIIAPMKRLLLDMFNIGPFAFEPLRFVDGDGDRGELNPDFPLNNPEYAGAEIMLTGENFGCGSSREMAAQGIADMGFRCLIGVSFGSIFMSNCFQTGILPIALREDIVETMVNESKDGEFSVDLIHLTITTPSGRSIPFTTNQNRREMLLEGLDDVGITLKKHQKIKLFEDHDKLKRPWLYLESDERSNL